MSASDYIALFAVLVSVGTFFWTLRVETRLKGREESRFIYDGLVGSPIEARLARLDEIGEALASCILENTEVAARSQAISRIVKLRYNSWYFAYDGFLQATDQISLDELGELLSEFHDKLAAELNRVGEDLTEQELDDLANNITASASHFVTRTRAAVHAIRLDLQPRKLRKP